MKFRVLVLGDLLTMQITIMATVGSVLPSSRYIIFTQFLKKYFNQPYSGSFGYQILLALSTDLMGYGLAGIMRKILVYPSYCLYPKSLVTIALNNSLHRGKSFNSNKKNRYLIQL